MLENRKANQRGKLTLKKKKDWIAITVRGKGESYKGRKPNEKAINPGFFFERPEDARQCEKKKWM